MATNTDEFGRFFRNRRTALDLSLSEFCRQNGFDKGNISRLERGLVKPPGAPDLLRQYAEALQLQPDSEDWKTFIRHAAVARGELPPTLSAKRAARVEAVFRRLDRRLHDPWVKAVDLERWSPTREAQAGLPTLVRRLIHATAEQLTHIELPGGEGIQRHGWDGIVKAEQESLFVPEGVSAWEISVNQDPKRKANDDFASRTKDPLGLPPAEVTFVFVTSRKWDDKQAWRDEKQKLRRWKSVEVYDSSDLEAWLEIAPGVDAWIAERLGRRPPGAISIGDHWESLSRLCEPRLTPELFLASREKTAEALGKFLLGTQGVMPIECRSPSEALDFVAAYLATPKSEDAPFALEDGDRTRVQNRTVVVKDRAQWDGLSQAAGQLNLVPLPALPLTREDLAAAVSRGHRILTAATKFANHRLNPISLPRPSRDELEKALCKSGFDREKARGAARTAGGSLSALKRCISTIPDSRQPKWCDEPALTDFLPILLAGAWDGDVEEDRTALSQLADRPYADLEKTATRFSLAEDAPLTRIESRWRLVSPEDSWTLIGDQVTDDLLDRFESTAIKTLNQQDDTLSLSEDERLKASILGTQETRASDLLRRAFSETTAILGSGFGLAKTLPRAREHAVKVVRETLHNATWMKWATLGDALPLLAEAAPEAFLDAVEADLKKKRPQLAKLLADDAGTHPLMSRCNHANLLWALEGLAWNPELLPRVCAVLARLDEVDTGRKNTRPANSLCKILLPRYAQTTADVDKRIAVLKSLAKRKPVVAWKLLLSMLPRSSNFTVDTHRPIWRDWMSDWQEGTSVADYWKQVEVAADLMVELAGNDLSHWMNILDKIHIVPEPHRTRLVERLQSFPVDTITAEDRRRLAEHLRRTVQRHTDREDRRQTAPPDWVAALKSALPTLLSDDVLQRHAWLFAQWVTLEGFSQNRDAMHEELKRLRADAVKRVLEESGWDGVLGFATIVESPRLLGATLASGEHVTDSQILPALLRSPDANCRDLAAGYAERRIDRDGWNWFRHLPLKTWCKEDASTLLAHAGLAPEVWQLAANLGEDISVGYWKTVPAYAGTRLTKEQLEHACRELMAIGRPDAAIATLSGLAYCDLALTPQVVMDVLAGFLESRQSNPDANPRDDTLHTIQELFGWLQKTVEFANDEPTRRLAQLEGGFLSLLDGHGAAPVTLIRYLSDDPAFFAELIARLFRSNNEKRCQEEPSEGQRQWARQGYRLLMLWDRIPGTQPDGSIDEDQLLRWIESARSLCRESGHADVADSRIGEMLATSQFPQPENAETMWPCEAICDAIEEASSEPLNRGFEIGIYNSRGMVPRSLLEGGDPERKEAAKYRKWAELCTADWPTTADSLRRVAKGYEFEAQQQDARAAEQAQERY